VEIDSIKKINNLSSDKLQPGQLLILIDGVGGGAAPSGTAAATSGDSWAASPGATPPAKTGESATEPVATINVPDTNANSAAPTDTAKTDTATEGANIDVNALEKLPHFVQPNDTLEEIATMYGSKPEWILKVNPEIKGNESLKEGMEIKVPYQDKKR
jgi:LysM repeat protein